MSRQPTVLFIEADGGASSDAPYSLQLVLRKPSRLSDARQIYMRGEDLSKRGMIFDKDTDSMCCGGFLLPSRVFEQNMNIPGGRIRMITQYDTELKSFSLFRERPGVHNKEDAIAKTIVSPSIVSSSAPWSPKNEKHVSNDNICELLRGKWIITRSSFTNARGASSTGDMGDTFSLRELDNIANCGRQVLLRDDSLLSAFGGGIASRAPRSVPSTTESVSIELLVRSKHTLRRITRKYADGKYVGTGFSECEIAK